MSAIQTGEVQRDVPRHPDGEPDAEAAAGAHARRTRPGREQFEPGSAGPPLSVRGELRHPITRTANDEHPRHFFRRLISPSLSPCHASVKRSPDERLFATAGGKMKGFVKCSLVVRSWFRFTTFTARIERSSIFFSRVSLVKCRLSEALRSWQMETNECCRERGRDKIRREIS